MLSFSTKRLELAKPKKRATGLKPASMVAADAALKAPLFHGDCLI